MPVLRRLRSRGLGRLAAAGTLGLIGYNLRKHAKWQGRALATMHPLPDTRRSAGRPDVMDPAPVDRPYRLTAAGRAAFREWVNSPRSRRTCASRCCCGLPSRMRSTPGGCGPGWPGWPNTGRCTPSGWPTTVPSTAISPPAELPRSSDPQGLEQNVQRVLLAMPRMPGWVVHFSPTADENRISRQCAGHWSRRSAQSDDERSEWRSAGRTRQQRQCEVHHG